jgi:hypothetical protein
MGWAIRGSGNVKTGGVLSSRLPRQDVGAFLECRQPLSFLCIKQLAKTECLVSYKRAFVLEHSVTHLLIKAHALFLTGETHKGVRFLMRQSLSTPKK